MCIKTGGCNDIHIRIVDGVHEVVELKSTKRTIFTSNECWVMDNNIIIL